MKRGIKKFEMMVSAMLLAMLALSPLVASPVSAINVFPACGDGSSSEICGEAGGSSVAGLVATLTGLLFFVIGVIAVIVIIVSGIKYMTADGDSSKIKSAKDTLFYAVIGLVVSIMAYAIVIFIVNWFS